MSNQEEMLKQTFAKKMKELKKLPLQKYHLAVRWGPDIAFSLLLHQGRARLTAFNVTAGF
jgi:hypothetical protein